MDLNGICWFVELGNGREGSVGFKVAQLGKNEACLFLVSVDIKAFFGSGGLVHWLVDVYEWFSVVDLTENKVDKTPGNGSK